MLVRLLTGHINLYFKQHKMRKAKNFLCRRCDAGKEMSERVLCECLVLEKIRMHTLGFARMDPDQINEARLSGIAVLSKEAGLLNRPL